MVQEARRDRVVARELLDQRRIERLPDARLGGGHQAGAGQGGQVVADGVVAVRREGGDLRRLCVVAGRLALRRS